MYVSKAIRALITLGVLLLLGFATVSSTAAMRDIPRVVLIGGASAAITYGISLLFRDELPLGRRLGTAYLAFVGITYVIPSAVGLGEHMDFVVTSIWNRLVDPYLLIWLSGHARADLYQLPDSSSYFMPPGVNYRFSYAVITASVIAIVAALGMTRSSKIGLVTWTVLLGASLLFSGCYIYVGIYSWGISGIGVQMFWEASYIVAFGLATRHVKWGHTLSE
jgi:hypothetical protein